MTMLGTLDDNDDGDDDTSLWKKILITIFGISDGNGDGDGNNRL